MLTILLVEDNEAIVLGLEYLLKEEGYRLLAAEDVKSAREILAKEQPDLVLLDVALPDGTGFDLCREIKAKDLAPVIFLTARDEERDVVLGFDLGADDYVIKPFRNRELLSLNRQCAAPLRESTAARPRGHPHRRGGGKGLPGRGGDLSDQAGISDPLYSVFQSQKAFYPGGDPECHLGLRWKFRQ